MKIFVLVKEKLKKTKIIYVYRIIRRYIKTVYYKTLSDERFLNNEFKKRFGREISKDNPQSFNEKLQWLKLYWYDSKAEICADKYAVREYLQQQGIGHLLNGLIAVYNNVDDICFDELPEKFVLKCTHGSACNIICENKFELNLKATKKKLKKWMNTNYYWFCREWVYKNIKPRIICEEFLEDEHFGELIDYKFFCFNGIPQYIMVCTDRFSYDGMKVDFYNNSWGIMEFERDYPRSQKKIPKPKNYESMLTYSKQISSGFPFVRVDFYEANGKLYFGELTFFPGGGFEKFQPEKYDFELGKEIKLPNCNK